MFIEDVGREQGCEAQNTEEKAEGPGFPGPFLIIGPSEPLAVLSLVDGHVFESARPDVLRTRANEFVVRVLL